MTVAEILAIGAAVEALERPAAKERQKEHGRTAPGKKNTSGKFPEVKGQTRDRVAAAVGVSGRTYEKAKQVATAAEIFPQDFRRELMGFSFVGDTPVKAVKAVVVSFGSSS